MTFVRMLRRNIRWIVFFGTLTIIATYIGTHISEYRDLLRLSPGLILALMVLACFEVLLLGLVNTLFFRGLGIPLHYPEGIGLAAINSVANLLPFAGGIASKAVYLKQRHGMSYGRFLGATLALYVCFVSASGLLGLMSLLYGVSRGLFVLHPLLLGVFLGMVSAVVVFSIPVLNFPIPRVIRNRTSDLADGWEFLRKHRRLAGQLMILQILMTVLIGVRFWLAFRIISAEISIIQSVLLASSAVLSLVITFAPGGLGVREGIVTALAVTLGFTPALSLIAVSIDRLTSTAVVLCLGLISSYVLGQHVLSSRSLTQRSYGGEQP